MRTHYSTKKSTDLPTTSGYFNNEPHGPTEGYNDDAPVQYVKRERLKTNADINDKLLFEKLNDDYLKHINNKK